MGDARRFSRREICVTGELLAGEDVPQTEFSLQPPVRLTVTPPVTSACALMERQLWNCGGHVDVW